MIVQRRLILNLLARQRDPVGRARARCLLLPEVFDTDEYRSELDSLGLDTQGLTTVRDRVGEHDPGQRSVGSGEDGEVQHPRTS